MKKFLDLGLQPLANSYLDQKDLNKIVINKDVVKGKIQPMLVYGSKENQKITVNKS